MSVLKLYDAHQLAKRNAVTHAPLLERQSRLERSNEQELRSLEASRASALARVLDAFEAAFTRIKHLDMEEVERLDTSSTLHFSTPALRPVRLSASSSVAALASSVATGMVASAAATSFATGVAVASTGVAVSTLSGAAATSALLAWFGGGSLASGGGGVALGSVVLGGVVAVPALVVMGAFAHHQGNKAVAEQRRVEVELKAATSSLATSELQWRGLRARSKATRLVLDRLVAASLPRVGWLVARLDADPDYRRFSGQERAQLAVLTGLVTTTITVLQSQPQGLDDNLARVSREIVAAADAHLRDVGSVASP